jgi:DNA-binding NarL/FixJ family response regulator
MIRILLVDDQQLVRSGIVSLLSLSEEVSVCAEASDGIEALDALDQHSFDVVLMDIQMPRMDGIEATKTIKQTFPHIPIIMLTTFDDKQQVSSALSAGARGYLLKDTSLEALVDAIHSVLKGQTLIQPIAEQTIKKRLENRDSLISTNANVEALTTKELEVLRLMSSGFSNQEIAEALFRSTGTIKNQVSNILAKLDTRDRTRAVLKALELGLI